MNGCNAYERKGREGGGNACKRGQTYHAKLHFVSFLSQSKGDIHHTSVYQTRSDNRREERKQRKKKQGEEKYHAKLDWQA